MDPTPGGVLGGEVVNKRLVTLRQTDTPLPSLAHLLTVSILQKDLGSVTDSNTFVLPE